MSIPWEAILSFVLYIIASTVGFVWWMATVTEQLKSLKDLVKGITDNNALYARKEDVAREMGVLEKRQETMWEKLDILKEKVGTVVK